MSLEHESYDIAVVDITGGHMELHELHDLLSAVFETERFDLVCSHKRYFGDARREWVVTVNIPRGLVVKPLVELGASIRGAHAHVVSLQTRTPVEVELCELTPEMLTTAVWGA